MADYFLKHGSAEGTEVVIQVCDFESPDTVVHEVRVGYGSVPADLNKNSSLMLDATEEERWVGAVAGAAVDELKQRHEAGEELPSRIELDLVGLEAAVRAGTARQLTLGVGRALGSI